MADLGELLKTYPQEQIAQFLSGIGRFSTPRSASGSLTRVRTGKSSPSKNLSEGLKAFEKSVSKPQKIRTKRQRTIRKKAKKGELPVQTSVDKTRLRAPKKLRRFIIRFTCKVPEDKYEDKNVVNHDFYFVYRGKSGTDRGIKQSATIQHNKAFNDHSVRKKSNLREVTVV